MEKLTASEYLDSIIDRHNLKNDAELCFRIGVLPSAVSKIRKGKAHLGLHMMLRLHEHLECSIAEMRLLIREEEFTIAAQPVTIEKAPSKQSSWLEHRGRLLKFFSNTVQQEGASPTFSEIAQHFHYSITTAHKYARRLESEGAVKLIPGKNRKIVILDSALAKLTESPTTKELS